MERAFSLCVIMGSAMFSCSQNVPPADIPSLVINTFQERFVDAVDIEWRKINGSFEAEFEIENMDHAVKIDSSGKILIYMHEISSKELPEVIVTEINSGLQEYKLDEIDRIEAGGKIYYRLELEGNGAELTRLYTAEGKEDRNIKIELNN